MPLKEDIIDPYPHTGESEAKGRGPPEGEMRKRILRKTANCSEKAR